MTSKKFAIFAILAIQFISYYFSKQLTCIPWIKSLKKHFKLMKVNVKKLSEYITKQLKYHQHRIRSKISISL